MTTIRFSLAAALLAASLAANANANANADADTAAGAQQQAGAAGGPAQGAAGPGAGRFDRERDHDRDRDHGNHDGDHDHHGPGGPGAGGLHGLHRLHLTEAQQDKLFAIEHAAAPQRRDQDKALRKAHDALRELGRADRFDEARAGAAARDLGQAVAAQALLEARLHAQVLAVLTPEQREQLRQQRPPGPPVGP